MFEWGKKQYFTNGESVVIFNIDNKGTTYEGKIKGKSFEHTIDSYIVELTAESKVRALSQKAFCTSELWDCFCITEACLKRPGE